MITKSLKEFASPIITKAMETGGRSSTTTTTNYGGIGDALTKKAQMEYNMATFKADMNMKMNEMATRNKLQIIDIEDARIDKELADRRASEDMGDMEKAIGTIKGVVSGAVTGMAVSGGNPIGGVIGGVAGGAMVANDAYSGQPGDVKRARVNNTNQTLGQISSLAVTARGMYDKYKGGEIFKDASKDLQGLQTTIERMSPGAARNAKIQEYQTKLSAMQGSLTPHLGIEGAQSAVEGIRKGQSGLVSNDPAVRTDAEIAQLGTQMLADPELQPGSPTRHATLQKYKGHLDSLIGRKYGFDKAHQVSPQEFSQFAGGVSPELGQAVTDMYSGQGGISAMPASQRQADPNYRMDPKTGAPINQPAPQQSISVPGYTGGTAHIPVNRGAVMDDGGPIQAPAAAETQLANQGAKAVEVLDKSSSAPQEEQAPNLLEQRIEKIRKSGMADTLTDERVREIATYELKKEGHENLESGDNQWTPEVKKKVAALRQESQQLDAAIESKFEEAKPYLIDKDDKDASKNIKITIQNVNKQERLIDRLPSGSQVKAKAAEFLLKGMQEGKDKSELLGSMFLIKGGVATAMGAGAIDRLVATKGGMGKGSAKMVSAILSKDEIAAVEEYAQNETQALQAIVKTGDKGVVNEGEVKLMRDVFFNHGMTPERKQQRLNGIKEDMLNKMSAIRETAEPFYKASQNKERELIHYRGQVQVGKAYEEQMNREQARNVMDMQKAEMQEGAGGWFTIRKAQ